MTTEAAQSCGNTAQDVKSSETTTALANYHRGSDASDASNSHLMVYGEMPERKSSISFDKIKQISLSYSLQSDDAADMNFDNSAVKEAIQSDRPMLENGDSHIVLAGDQLQVITSELVGSFQPQQCSPNEKNRIEKTSSTSMLEGFGSLVNGRPTQAAESHKMASNLVAGQSALINDVPDRVAAGGAGRQSSRADRRNPFVIFSGADDDDDDNDESDEPGCEWPDGAQPETASVRQQRLRPSRSPARAGQRRAESSAVSSTTCRNAGISKNNNPTISLKLAKNTSANIIIDDDDDDDDDCDTDGCQTSQRSARPLSAILQDRGELQFNSDGSGSRCDISRQRQTPRRRPLETGRQLKQTEAKGSEFCWAAAAAAGNQPNNGLDQSRGGKCRAVPDGVEELVKRWSPNQAQTSDSGRRQANRSRLITRDPNFRVCALATTTRGQRKQRPTIAQAGDCRGPASDNSWPFFGGAVDRDGGEEEEEDQQNDEAENATMPPRARQRWSPEGGLLRDEGSDLLVTDSGRRGDRQQQGRILRPIWDQRVVRSGTPQPEVEPLGPPQSNCVRRLRQASQRLDQQQQLCTGASSQQRPAHDKDHPKFHRTRDIVHWTGRGGSLSMADDFLSPAGSLAWPASDRRRRRPQTSCDVLNHEHSCVNEGQVDWALATPRRHRSTRRTFHAGQIVLSSRVAPMQVGLTSDYLNLCTPTRRRRGLSECDACRHQESTQDEKEEEVEEGCSGELVGDLHRASDELEQETKQISIIIGTPKRRHRPAARRLAGANSGSSTTSMVTPPPRLKVGRDVYYCNHDDNYDDEGDYDYDQADDQSARYNEPRLFQRGQLACGGGGEQRRRCQVVDQRRWPDADDFEPPGTRWTARASDNFELSRRPIDSPQTQAASAREAPAIQQELMLSRRSTISSSSECGAGQPEYLADGGRRQFQRRPTGPFELERPAGGVECGGPRPLEDGGGNSKMAGTAAAATVRGEELPQQINSNAASQSMAPASGNDSKPRAQIAAAEAQIKASRAHSAPAQKPIKLRNLITGEQSVDTFHAKAKLADNSKGCAPSRCLGSLIDPVPVVHSVRSPDETLKQARDFIDGYYTSIKRFDTPAHKNRLLEIEEQITSTETYYLRETELIYGAKLAWRNAPRCIGRIQWSKLQVFDARFTRNADEMFEAICNHIKYATNRGSLRSAITIFPQRVKSTQNDWRVWNLQLIGFAGYKDKETGKVVGDPMNAQITEICQRLGWQGKGTQFDVLPLVLQANGGPPKLFPLPEELVLRVQMSHPNLDWFRELQLEWYALPAVSNMLLDVGGLQFTACPFNGWYMVTEIGTRNLADQSRYNMLEPIAQRMGLNTTTNLSLWRDQALTQLNLAVLHSFQQANVTIVDHHTACETFMTHLKNEQRLRGGCPADWVWLVPPTAGSTTQVFHQEMVNYHVLPNYEYLQPAWKNFDWLKWERMRQESKGPPKVANALEDGSTAAAGGGASGAAAAANAPAQTGAGTPMAAKLSLIKASTSSLSPLSRARIGVNEIASASHMNHSAAVSPAIGGANANELTPRHLRFKEIARAVKFTSKLFGKALSRRIKATILYATETGKSERFANKLAQTFSHAFNVHLMSMSDYDMTCLEHEALLLIVTSTFGNGDPPENGELFAKHLAAIKMTGDSSPDIDSINSVSTNPFFQMLSEDHSSGGGTGGGGGSGAVMSSLGAVIQATGGSLGESPHSSTSGGCDQQELDDDTSSSSSSSSISTSNSLSLSVQPTGKGATTQAAGNHQREPNNRTSALAKWSRKRRATLLVRSDNSTGCQLNQEQQTNIKPLSNVRFAVFALGSTAYPHFCAFGRYVDQTLGDLGAERILKCHCGDELSGQEKAFTEWTNQVFRVACDVFCLSDTVKLINMERPEVLWTPKDVRFEYVEDDESGRSTCSSTTGSILQNLAGVVGKKILPFSVKRRLDLHAFSQEEGLQTICVELDSPATRSIRFEPGDHIGIYPVNKPEVVNALLERIQRDLKLIEDDKNQSGQVVHNMDKRVSILIKRGNMDPLTQADEWAPFETLPITSIRLALTRYLDITNPPSQDFLSILARLTSDLEEKKRLQQMARTFAIYESWKTKKFPSLLSTLDEFKSVRFDPALITQIPAMKPRFYSVSGTSIALTLGVVRYKTADGEPREGLCSNYLNEIPIDPKSKVFGYVRSAPAFHMPQDKTVPMLLISAGTGIAPFRSFWQQRKADIQCSRQQDNPPQLFGRIEFYFGCRNSKYILYKEELDQMHNQGVLSSINVAFSRPLDRDVLDEDTTRQTTSSLSTIDSIRQPRKRMYVQDKLFENHKLVFKSIIQDGSHIYVCGDVAMASGVYKTLAKIININLKANSKLARQQTVAQDQESANSKMASGKSDKVDLVRSGQDGDSVLMNLRNLNRYHEDIFGARQV